MGRKAGNTEGLPVQIQEYDLVPKRASYRLRRSADEVLFDELFSDQTAVAADVRKEAAFKRHQEKKSASKPDPVIIPQIKSYSEQFVRSLITDLQGLLTQIEKQKLIVGHEYHVGQPCYKLRECPDHRCASFQASNARCWFVAGETCGCRTHLGIKSCFECQVFQMATPDPATLIRETFYYALSMIRHRNERLRAVERENQEIKDRLLQLQRLQKVDKMAIMDETLFEQQLISDIVTFSNQQQKFETPKDQEIWDQHKILTEQLGSAYLQLQSLTAELERNNKQLEDKINERTDELRKSNMALRDAVKKAQEADRLKSEFIANVSHELRTPLNSIIGFSKVLLGGIDGEITETQQVDLTAIYNSGRHLLEIINSILELSKIEAGKMELHITTFDLVPIVKEVVTSGQSLVIGKRVKVESQFDGVIPVLEADVTKVRQIVLNLLSNAAKFTEEGYISVRVRAEENNVIISVIDSGVGIDKNHLDTIFDRFRQVDGSSTRRAGGTGLGLSIVRRFVEMHNGTIDVDSKPSKGSVFTVSLPIKHVPVEKKVLEPGI